MDKVEFPSAIAKLIETLPKTQDDVRCVFYLEGSHSIPVAYVKENGKKFLVVSDSKGGKKDDLADLIAEAFAYQKVEDIQVFRVSTPRQADLYSCFSDAMKFAVLVTARRKNEHTGDFEEYLIPQLGEQMNTRQVPSDTNSEPSKVASVLLPNECLRLAQLTRFINEHLDSEAQDNPLRGDAKGRRWDQFQTDYERTFTTGNDGAAVTKPRADYLRQKGVRYAQIVEIEYYNDQLKTMLGDKWSIEQQNELVDRLKKVARS